MKQLLTLTILLTCLWAKVNSQTKTKEDKAFEVPENIVIMNRFYIDLEKGNKLTVELTDASDWQRIMNIDSILSNFFNDMKQLKDSLSDPLTSKRVDYVVDAQGRKKIRILRYQSKGDNFLIKNGDWSALKINQDTINIIGVINNPPKATLHKVSRTNPRYYHLLFYLNSIEDLTPSMTTTIAGKFATINKPGPKKWPILKGGGSHYLKGDKSIVADKPGGATEAGTGDFIALQQSLNIQNYKSYFVPSFSLGIKLGFTNAERTFKWEPALYWEPHFLFARDAQGKLRTYRNDFLTLTYGQGGIPDHNPLKDFTFSAVFSLGYLIHQSGDFIQKDTYRLGAGKLRLLKTTIEPSIYFNHFFKGVTPGIRISQSF